MTWMKAVWPADLEQNSNEKKLIPYICLIALRKYAVKVENKCIFTFVFGI